MKVANWKILFQWFVSSWKETSAATILNDSRVSFGENDQLLEIEEEDMEVNDTKIQDVLELVEILGNFTIVDDDDSDRFTRLDV